MIDGEEKKSGSLFEDFSPHINPPQEIDDPEDTKPEDWVDTAKYANPSAALYLMESPLPGICAICIAPEAGPTEVPSNTLQLYV